MSPEQFTNSSDWGVMVAILLIFAGASNLLALYSIARFYSRRERKERRKEPKGRNK